MGVAIWACAVCVVLATLLLNFFRIDTTPSADSRQASLHADGESLLGEVSVDQLPDTGNDTFRVAGEILFERLLKMDRQATIVDKQRQHLCELLRRVCREVRIAGATQMRSEHMCMKQQLQVLLPDSSLLSRIRAQVCVAVMPYLT